MLSLIGILAGLAVFIIFAFRGVNVVISAVTASVVILLFSIGSSETSILESMTGVYMTGFSGFVKSYFLLFAMSSLFGKIMSDAGAAKRIALAVAKLVGVSARHQKFLCALTVPILYSILSYVGISGFVMVFTVMPIALDLYRESDVPWRFFCYGGAIASFSPVLIGSLYAGNIYASDICGTDTMAAPVLSIVCFCVYALVVILLIAVDLKVSKKKGEGFMATGADILKSNVSSGIAEDQLPKLLVSLIPMILVILLSTAVKVNVVLCLLIGCAAGIVLWWRHLPGVKATLAAGVSSSFGPVINVAATFAIGSIIKAQPGFVLFTDALSALPPLLAGASVGILGSFALASTASCVPAFGPLMLERFTEAGLNAAASHRMITISAIGIAPHSAGIPNASSVLRISFSDAAKIYMKGTYIPGFCALIVGLVLVSVGIVF